MRLLSVLIVRIACAAIPAGPLFSAALPPPGAGAEVGSILDLRDAWPGIATATNDWAKALRKLPQWQQVNGATLAQTEALARDGAALAQLRLGYTYFAGDGVERDYPTAVRWLRPASDAQFAPAQFLLGVANLNGWGVPRDFETGVDLLNRAAEQGFADAEFQLGICYLKGGAGVNQAPARGVKWLTRAAEQGKAPAQQFLAWCFSSGTGVQEDPAQAFQWCNKAAQQGMDSAQDFLGMFWASGYGTNRDWAQAVLWFRRAASQGLGTAQIHLAQCYANGKGVERDLAQSLYWWQSAADRGFPSAAFHAGLCYYQGLGTNRDLPLAVDRLLKAAQQGHVGAQLYLGLCFWKGIGVNRDPEAAQKWWREAAVNGIVHRLPELGDDPADIETWWVEVAEQANPRLQCCLAEFYRFGQGVPQSDAKALRWYRKASATGDLAALKAAAWLMATSPESDVRDGRGALELARKAASASKRQDPKALDALAAAYAESSQFSKAIGAENEAIALAQEDDEKKEYQSRLKLYQSKTAFRSIPELRPVPQLE
ncbi:MAG TPA: SEL1-like repeat protein [Verrucomicrobiae bacterium]|nr:SEL1-like repeat protein [Verrucomicrobiae bacterium]